MNISYNWLKQYVKTELSAQEIEKILTSIGLEVEGLESFESVKGGLEGFVVGEVKTCVRHPNADKLSLTQVDIGEENFLSIVCGAPNVAVGQKVIVATIGTTIYKGEENFKILKSKIRGEISEGMICAEDEIGIGSSHEGILILDSSVNVGTAAKEYFQVFSDKIFVIGLTPNRIDSASHIGVARDLAAYLNTIGTVEKVMPMVDNFMVDDHSRVTEVIIENSEAAPRYAGLTISGVTIKPSPKWLQDRLSSIGLHPINNIVDVTNFILHELGQPLHAFDADKISGGKVVVKTLPAGSKFRTLDNTERALYQDDLMICDREKGMCIAGVFGGIESGVSSETKAIFLESACFNPVYVRKTAKRHGLNTDASFLFERGTDPNLPVFALKRAAMLIKEVAGGRITSPITDIYPNKVKDFPVTLEYEYMDDLIGKKLDRDLVKKILLNLDIKVEAELPEGLQLLVSPYRVDVQRPADVVEEILRIYGYNNVEFSQRVLSTLSYPEKPDKEKVMNQVCDWLSSNGFNEMLTNSLTRSDYYQKLESYSKENLVYIMNPLSQDLNCMRQTLLFGGLEAVVHNINRKNPDLKLYEFGNTYKKEVKHKDQVLPGYTEEYHLHLLVTGLKNPSNWVEKEVTSTFYSLKSYAENLLLRIGIQADKAMINEISDDIFSQALTYNYNQQQVLNIGRIHKSILNQFDIKQPVFCADFNWTKVLKLLRTNAITFEELPRFPEVKRDLSLVLNKEVRFEQLRALALKTDRKLLKRVNLFDVYEGDKIEAGKKSYAISFYLQSDDKTLTDQEIFKIMNNLIHAFEKELGAQVRS